MKNKIIILIIAMSLSVFTGCQGSKTVGKEPIQDNEVPLEDEIINDESQDGDSETTENNNNDVTNENEENNNSDKETTDSEIQNVGEVPNNKDNNNNSNTVIEDNKNENSDDSKNNIENNDSLDSEDPTSTDEAESTDDGNGQELLNGELSPIIEKIYEIKDPELKVGNITVDLSNMDTVNYYTGLIDVSKVKDVLVSESMIGSQAYSLVFVRVNDSADSESVANEMLNGINSSKWICVQADDLQVVTHDDLILLIMVSSTFEDTITSQQIVDAFKEICGDDFDIELKK